MAGLEKLTVHVDYPHPTVFDVGTFKFFTK